MHQEFWHYIQGHHNEAFDLKSLELFVALLLSIPISAAGVASHPLSNFRIIGIYLFQFSLILSTYPSLHIKLSSENLHHSYKCDNSIIGIIIDLAITFYGIYSYIDSYAIYSYIASYRKNQILFNLIVSEFMLASQFIKQFYKNKYFCSIQLLNKSLDEINRQILVPLILCQYYNQG